MAHDSQALFEEHEAVFEMLCQDTPEQEQLTALRIIKNDIIGHTQKKEEWMRHGILALLFSYVHAIEDRRPDFLPSAFANQDEMILQTLNLLASFANGGPGFVFPLYNSGFPRVTSRHLPQNSHPQIVLATLRLVRNLVASASYVKPCFVPLSGMKPVSTETVAELLFGPESDLECLRRILSQPSSISDRTAADQISMVAHLIKDLCRDEGHREALADNGILDALASNLASIAVAQGQVLPRAETIALFEGLEDHIPKPAHPATSLDGILGAIAAIITDSPYRTCKLLFSPSILAIFPIANVDPTKSPKSAYGPMELPGLRPTKHMDFEPMNLLLPRTVPHILNRTAFPPPSTSRESFSRNGRSASRFHSNAASRAPSEDAFASNNDAEGEEAESPLIPWLITLIRSRQATEMLMATSVLTSLFKAGFCYKTREADLGLLVVPVLLRMLNNVIAKLKDIDYNNCSRDIPPMLNIIEQAPTVLARLITDSEPLQKAAFECNAVKTACKLLKDTYDPTPPFAKMWSWTRHNGDTLLTGPPTADHAFWVTGEHHYVVHRMKIRESALRAIGALATFKDEYRKAIVDQGVISYIVASLDRRQEDPDPVVIAACYAIRMLSRSVSILRTALVDNSVTMPLFQLLRVPVVDLQIAAADTVCNLVMDVSPVRKELIGFGIVKVLAELAHSHPASLRVSALWALKHLALSSPVELKKSCVEELGSGWLVRLVKDDMQDETLFGVRERSVRQATYDALDDIDENMDTGPAEDQRLDYITDYFYKKSATRSQADARIVRLADARLEVLREVEWSPVRKARHEDLAIQEQGLGLIRNLIGGAHSSTSADSPNETTEMIDFLFERLGQDQLFSILGDKLKVKVLHPSSRQSAGSETRILPPQTKIIESVIYILVHIAASVPRHRHLVVSQIDLLKQLAKLFSSHDREVRIALCHLINNLTWQDNANDAPGCVQRALELKKLGFLSKLESLKEGDDELDVRERARSALWQMKPAY